VCDVDGEAFAPGLVPFPPDRLENREELRLPPKASLRNLPDHPWRRSLRSAPRARVGLPLGGELTEHGHLPVDRRPPLVPPGLLGVQAVGGSAVRTKSAVDQAVGESAVRNR
jgi:hypothetical protein